MSIEDVSMAASMSSPLDVAVSLRDRNVIDMVKEAIEIGNVLLAFQPVVMTATPDHPAFYEALARVRDKTGRIIPAAQFMNEIETHEIGRLLDCRSLELGLKKLIEMPKLRLSINMSARSIGYKQWVRTLETAPAEHPNLGKRLILEITESSAMVMPDIVRMFMGDLQSRGVTFALDDFGAGYTSFRYLRDFYFDILKIDGQFIRGISDDTDNQVLIEALMAVGRHFEMFTVAESVESAQDAAYLSSIGMDCLQGYYYGVPSLTIALPSSAPAVQAG
ncbi:MAG: EAL domain-containing protein [Rhodobacteraceae bacterium]|nr:EAL domain-containing protein [Paracoccaceae bacterium]